ncbi:MAG TPA: VWA domain-containing protein [Bryobacteraceae bacterium]|nr:VWA domain-containing protein [Bryobacteraceae bacterium]HOQ46785.1 VWA domain-containing protein [Bryobacteraceae bacterium]HPQ17012.1 VWA domain-containing protein [Bryobacteraceae bacterium]HPU73575.1 VWA domain-containing protein [Bryobacteraceae bacterium]
MDRGRRQAAPPYMFGILSCIRAAAVCALASLTVPAAAQEVVFRSDSRLVVLHATVLDKDGNRVTDLPKSAFRVFENGVEQELKIFRREDAPVSLGFLIDDSGSMINRREKVAASAMSLLRASHPDDEGFVVHFNEKTYLDTEFTTDRAKLERGLTTFDSRGSTAMRDALRLAIEHMDRRASEDKKVIVVVTDGEDNTSRVDRDFIVKAAQQSGVIIYAIGLLTDIPDERTEAARHELDAITRATGGRAYYLKDVSEADAAAQEIAREIRDQYTLAYSPSDTRLDGSYRRIQVYAGQDLVVRTRNGYYAGAKSSVELRRGAEPAP